MSARTRPSEYWVVQGIGPQRITTPSVGPNWTTRVLTNCRRVKQDLGHAEPLVAEVQQLLLVLVLLLGVVRRGRVDGRWRGRRRREAGTDVAELVGGIGEKVGEDVGADERVAVAAVTRHMQDHQPLRLSVKAEEMKLR